MFELCSTSLVLSDALRAGRGLGTSMSTAKTTVVWLRDELRLHDNALLASAVEQSAPMLPVFCLDPRIYSGDAVATNVPGTMPKCGARRTKFTLECLTDLATSLAAAGSLLHIVRDSPATALANVVDELHAFDSEMQVEVVCSEGICPEEIDDEEQVERALEQRGASLRRLWEGTMYHRDDVNGLPGPLPDDVFTNWRVKVEKAKTPIRDELRLRTPLPSPPQGADWSKSTVPSLADLGYDEADAVVDMRGDFFAPVGGEKAALARLRRYVWDEDRLKSYFETRNGMRGQGYSTKLAPWLARGCISPRRVAHECRRYEMERGIKNKSTYWVVFELTWRDYFSFLSRKYGRRLFWPSGFKGIGGRAEAWLGADNAAFKAWCSGQTGAPLVDANMRELVATGFMSNRGRQVSIVAQAPYRITYSAERCELPRPRPWRRLETRGCILRDTPGRLHCAG